jgi:urease accessory protein
MHSEVLVVARPGRLPRIEYRGAIAARSTHPDTVHLLAAQATPLGGDTINVRVVVEPGARLLLRSVSARVVLPGGDTTTSHSNFELEVAGSLDLDLEPMVIAADSRHLCTITLRIGDVGRVRLRERVQIGRCNERRQGFWSSFLRANVCSRPLVRQRIEIGAGSTADDGSTQPLAYERELRYPAAVAHGPLHAAATVQDLAAGGVLATWQGHRLV